MWDYAYADGDPDDGQVITLAAPAALDGAPAGVTTYTISVAGTIAEIRDAGHPDAPAGVVSTYEWVGNRLHAATDGTGATRRWFYDEVGLLRKVTEPAPNDPARADLPPGAPVGEVTHELTYHPLSAFTYPGCTEPAHDPGVPISAAGRCRLAADLASVTFGASTAEERRTTFSYDGADDGTGLLTAVTQEGGGDPDRTTTFTYAPGGLVATVDGPRADVSDVTVYDTAGYHRSGQPLAIRDALGATKTFAFDAYGRVETLVDRDGHTTQSTYDADGRLRSVLAPGDASPSTYDYDANGQRVAETTPGGMQTLTAHDPAARVVEVKGPQLPSVVGTPEEVRVATEWHPDGTTYRHTNPLGAVTTFTYHPNRSVATVSTPATTTATAVTDYAYDAAGRVARITSPVANASGSRPQESVTYTPGGGIATRATTAPMDGQADAVVRYAYDAFGAEIEALGPRADASGTARATTAYNAFGEVTESVRHLPDRPAAESVRAAYGYDTAGNQVSVTRSSGLAGEADAEATTTYAFDALGRLTGQLDDPLNPGHTVSYAYSGEGQQTERRDLAPGTERRTVTTYNPDGTRRATVAVQDGSSVATCNWAAGADPSSGYDADGELVAVRTVERPSGVDIAAAPGALEAAACEGGGETLATVALAYDGRGHLASTTQTVDLPGHDPIARSQSVSSDPAANVTGYGHRAGTAEVAVVDFTYDASGSGLLASVSGLGHEVAFDLVASGAPSAQSLRAGGTEVAAAAYDWRRDGSLASLGWSAGGTNVRSHTGISYDPGGLRSAESVALRNPDGSTSAGTAAFAYDLADRLGSWDDPFATGAATTTYALDAAGNIRSESGATTSSSTYAHGRLEARDGISFTYSALGEEASRSDGTTSTYDAAGRLRTRTDAAGATTTTYYDGTDRLLARIDASGVVVFFYWGTGGGPAEEADGSGTTKVAYLPTPDGEALGQSSPSATPAWTWLLPDAAGSVGTLLGDDGSVVEQRSYDPWGKPTAGGSARAPGTSAPTTLGFGGHIVDPASGSVVLGARLYDPDLRRFSTPDAFVASGLDLALASDPLTGNRYLYAAANPVGFYDDGHWPKLKLPNPIKAVKAVAKKALPVLAAVPYVGTGIEVVSIATGRDWADGGRKMSGTERLSRLALAAGTAVLGPAAGKAVRAVADKVGDATRARTVARAATREGADAVDDVGSPVAPNTTGGAGRVFTHFTDEAGAAGITGTRPLAVGQSAEVGQLTFAKGNNPFLVGEGRIGVTDLGLDATPGQLNGIGVFGPRQQYGIQFSELDAWNSGVRVMGDLPSRNIYSIPGGCTITGTCTVTRLR